MTNLYLTILLPIIWIHFLHSMVTQFSPEKSRGVRNVGIGLFAMVFGAMALFLLFQDTLILTFLIPALCAVIFVQSRVRLPVVSEFLFIVNSLLSIIAIASLATPSTTWGDGYKLFGLVFLPMTLFLSTLLFYQIRWRFLFGAAKVFIGVGSLAACIWLSVTHPPEEYAAEMDIQTTMVAINAALFQLVEGIIVLTANKRAN
ncbi:MAG: hypothetical protein JXX14_09295 [Deltaproteobacteria bacterium]|nr:hypothetical protein [Deltaproteobacteria bacterium]